MVSRTKLELFHFLEVEYNCFLGYTHDEYYSKNKTPISHQKYVKKENIVSIHFKALCILKKSTWNHNILENILKIYVILERYFRENINI